ncbi:MAG: hypothetical protein A2W26_04235 [Acidobacteria bacterium RBG_16_64_8]|nr:MAG: hypothetical protein A2W26_04235 [Acidobacteria bacterium RBG_16_64_8]
MSKHQKLSQAKVNEMWAAYQKKPTINHVVQKCGVSQVTVRRYRDREKWEERLAVIRAKANQKSDEDTAKMLARQARQARAIQTKALQRIVGSGFGSTRDASDAYFKATVEERVVRGEPGERTEVLLSEVKRRYAGRSEEKA